MGIDKQKEIQRERLNECEEEKKSLVVIIKRYENNPDVKKIFEDTIEDIKLEIESIKKFLREHGDFI